MEKWIVSANEIVTKVLVKSCLQKSASSEVLAESKGSKNQSIAGERKKKLKIAEKRKTFIFYKYLEFSSRENCPKCED